MTYITNLFLKDNLSIEVLGLYQASWTISNLYIGIILSSMGVAFFPKICKVISNEKEATKTINEQIEFGLLVSLPFIIGIFVFAPLILHILYSSDFVNGASIIRWQILGVTIRLLGFPFGYALMAKGKTVQYTVSQFIFSGLNYGFIVWITLNVGFDGLGLNYFAAYIVYLILVGGFCVKSIGYRVSPFLVKIIIVYAISFLVTGLALNFFQLIYFYILGGCIVLLTMYFSICQLQQQLDFNLMDFIKSKLKK
jgi:PST family polysaccharide transporter